MAPEIFTTEETALIRKERQERRAANVRHRKSVRDKALSALSDQLLDYGLEDDSHNLADYIVTWIEDGTIPNVTLNY